MTYSFAQIILLLACLAALLVTIAAIMHPRIQGWKMKLAVSIFFLAISSLEVGLGSILNMESALLRHRLLFWALACGSLTWSILDYLKITAVRRNIDLFTLAISTGYLLLMFYRVLPVWWFEKDIFLSSALMSSTLSNATLMSAFLLFFLTFIFAQTQLPSRRQDHSLSLTNRMLFESIVILTFALTFSLTMQWADLLVVFFEQIKMVTVLLVSLVLLARMVHLIWLENKILKEERAAALLPRSPRARLIPLRKNAAPRSSSVENFPGI